MASHQRNATTELALATQKQKGLNPGGKIPLSGILSGMTKEQVFKSYNKDGPPLQQTLGHGKLQARPSSMKGLRGSRVKRSSGIAPETPKYIINIPPATGGPLMLYNDKPVRDLGIELQGFKRVIPSAKTVKVTENVDVPLTTSGHIVLHNGTSIRILGTENDKYNSKEAFIIVMMVALVRGVLVAATSIGCSMREKAREKQERKEAETLEMETHR